MSSHIKKTAEHLSCPVCRQLYNNPKYLPCYHSYCERCIEKLIVQSKITCPECRQEAKVPPGGVKKFQSNFFVNRLMDDLIYNCKDNSEEVKCDNCDEDDPVVSYCTDCNFFLCQVCYSCHKRDKQTRRHSVVLLDNLKSAEILSSTKPPQCKDHDREMLFYCVTCAELICHSCTVNDHYGHEHDTVK